MKKILKEKGQVHINMKTCELTYCHSWFNIILETKKYSYIKTLCEHTDNYLSLL